MTNFQFILIMRTLLAIFHLKLNDYYTHDGWKKAFEDYEELQGMFGLWQYSANEINKANKREGEE